MIEVAKQPPLLQPLHDSQQNLRKSGCKPDLKLTTDPEEFIFRGDCFVMV